MGININDECQDFTGQILRGEKTIETRKTRSLDPYIGERVGIVRTGIPKQKATLVGYATVGEPVVYDSVAKFRRDYDKHLVAPGSAFDIKDGLKYGYPLMQVEETEPRIVESKGIVARRVNPYTKPDLRERLNPVTPSIRKKLASVIEFDDRILCYDTAADEDFYRLWDIIHTDLTLNKESLREIEGMLDDDGVLVIESGETPAGLQDHFRKTTRYQGLLLVQGPLNPEQARIETEKLRRDLE